MGPWSRADWNKMQHLKDGLTYGDFGESTTQTAMERFFPPSILRRVVRPPSLSAYLDLMLKGRLFGTIAVRDRYEMANSLQAGRVWQRCHLLATARGLAARPANQCVELMDQEHIHNKHPGQAELLAEITRDPSWQPTFMFFMGYPTARAHETVRRPAHEVVI